VADYGSRTVRADAADDLFDRYIYALVEAEPKEGAGDTVVPGHLPMAPMVAKIVAAQESATQAEKDSWAGSHFSTASLGGRTLVLYKNRLVVPKGATPIEDALMRLAHDDNAHYTGGERTLVQLVRQARVHSRAYRCTDAIEVPPQGHAADGTQQAGGGRGGRGGTGWA
jgi:hypothetical protein